MAADLYPGCKVRCVSDSGSVPPGNVPARAFIQSGVVYTVRSVNPAGTHTMISGNIVRFTAETISLDNVNGCWSPDRFIPLDRPEPMALEELREIVTKVFGKPKVGADA